MKVAIYKQVKKILNKIRTQLIAQNLFVYFYCVFFLCLFTEVESLRTSLASRTHFEVLGLGLKGQVLEATSPRKLPCPRLKDSTTFEPLKFCWKTPETSRKICEDLFLFFSIRDHLKKIVLRPFSPEKKF